MLGQAWPNALPDEGTRASPVRMRKIGVHTRDRLHRTVWIKNLNDRPEYYIVMNLNITLPTSRSTERKAMCRTVTVQASEHRASQSLQVLIKLMFP